MMKFSDVTASLQKFWSSNSPLEIPTLFSGSSHDVTHEDAWMEFWISQFEEPPKRKASPRNINLVVDIHLFFRGSNKRQVDHTIDNVSQFLGSESISISADGNPEQIVGTLRFEEPVVRDLTRNDDVSTSEKLQHKVLSLQAHALEQVEH